MQVSISNLLYNVPLTSSDTKEEGVVEFYLKDQNHKENDFSIATPQMQKKTEVVTSRVEVSGGYFLPNPAVTGDEEDKSDQECPSFSVEKSDF